MVEEIEHRSGKLALLVVENFVESKLGKKFVKVLGAQKDEYLAV